MLQTSVMQVQNCCVSNKIVFLAILLLGVSKVRSDYIFYFALSINASSGKCTLIQVRNLSE